MPRRHVAPTAAETPLGHLQEAELAAIVGYQIAQAALVTDRVFAEAAGEPHGLRQIEYTALTLIAENPGGSQARLARALAVTPPLITAVVDRLQARGLVERVQSTDDRRHQLLQVTDAGRALAQEASTAIIAAERAALPLSAAERAMLIELLHKVAAARAGR
jgi:DNA-binding MarR family transcriptional regulator